MVSASLPPNEEARLAALRSYAVLDTGFEKDYDELCRLAATICGTPMALISLVDQDRQWFKSVVGLDARETDRDVAFCAHAIWQDHVFEVPDATRDERFWDNPLVTGSPDIRFYAGMPLITDDGFALGTLCTLDRVPRTLEPHQKEALDILARQVVTHLELRRTLGNLKRLNEDKDRFFSIIAHDLRSPFSGLLGLSDLLKTHGDAMDRAELVRFIGQMHQALQRVYALADNLLKWALLEQGKFTYQPEDLAVSVLFDEAVHPLAETLAQKSLKLDRKETPGLRLIGDRNMLEAALRNLLSNAIKFTSAQGSITLEAVQTGAELRLSVEDRGVGMSAAQLAQLRAGLRTVSHPGTEGEAGTGLGLTLAGQFASRHGGRLEFQSEEGVGTTATLVLPLEG